MSATKDDVIEKVSFDKSCPKDEVEIISELQQNQQGSYKVEACGEVYEYERAGTGVYEKGHGPLDK